MAKGAMRFKSMTVGKQQGELARFRVLGGPDNGVVFVVTSQKVTIGRGEDCDIMLTDLKSSRKHAEFSVQGGQFSLNDLGSAHGFLVNGTAQKQALLRSGDKIGIGATVFEFVASSVAGATQMLVRPPAQTVRTVGTGNSGLTQFIPRPSAQPAGAPGAKTAGGVSVSSKADGFIEKNKKLIMMLGGLMALASLMPEADRQIQQKSKKQTYYMKADPTEASRNPALANIDYESVQFKDADKYYHLGLRELRQKNYLRAMAALETSIQIYPTHPQAQVYLKTAKDMMKKDAERHLKDAKHDEEANRFKSAMYHYDAIRRLYTNDQSNSLYKDADGRAKEIEKKVTEMERN